MTTPPPNKARKFYDAAVDLGWSVTKKADPDGTVYALCRRGDEQYNVAWAPGARGLVFVGGWHWVGEDAEAIESPADALKAMAKPARLDMAKATDNEVLDYLRGRSITWVNRMSQTEDNAVIPARSAKTRIDTVTEVRRSIMFVTPEGFRSVALDAITKVN